MRRIGIAVVSLVVLVAVLSPPAIGAKSRIERSTYDRPNGVAVWVVVDTVFSWGEDGMHVFHARRGEKTVEIVITDDYSPTAQGYVRINQSDAGGGTYFCESETFEVNPGDEITVLVLAGICPGGEPSAATSGVVEATFRR